MWRLLITGGYTMIPLLVCSVLILAVIIEKIITLRTEKVIPTRVISEIEHNPVNTDNIMKLCNTYTSSFAAIIKTVLINRGFSKSTNQENAQIEGKMQLQNMEKGLVVLEVIAAVAPLLGLLGTVLGLVDVFHVVAKVGVGQTSAFSSGIAKALVTTVVGLIIAIPALIAYRYFSKKIDSLILVMEKEVSGLINRLYNS